MTDNGIGDYFISDIDDEMLEEEDELISAPVVVPQTTAQPTQQQPPAAPPAPPQPAQTVQTVPAQPAPQAVPAQQVARPQALAHQASREDRLAAALDELMMESADIEAAALVSMDGFTMASALPQGMQEDRVGAMSAAILGLGERAAAELGRGHLTQVFIEGDEGYVVLIAAGSKAVLTTLAQTDAKLGLVLYDMKTTADVIAEILG
jgi:predicted regulator of Ras-like GTPase activity (Roadblock/LC7/MglB family)